MLDSFNRDINYMRISLLDTCDLRCFYCMPENVPDFLNNQSLLSFEQICAVVQASTQLGFHKFRLTGGEPLLRPNVEKLVEMMNAIDGVDTLVMTTNGTRLLSLAQPLKSAGLQKVNISLDTLDPDRYRFITRGGDITNVLQGIDKALEVGFEVKVNMVILDKHSINEMPKMHNFIENKGGSLQTIAQYRLDQTKVDQYIYDRPEPCSLCNRIRLTADGKIRTCLHSDDEYEIDFENIQESLKQAIALKPRQGTTSSNINVSSIGG